MNKYFSSTAIVDGATVTEKHYLAGIEYTGNTLEAIYHSEGRAFSLGGGNYEYQYTIKDHLDNSRVMYKVVTGTATILQENHHYAFGMELEHTGFVGSTNMYRYNLPAPKFARQAGGKELNDNFGYNLYAYGARWYDASVGRFTGVDPLSDKYSHVTTYNYAENSPISNIDLWGLQAENFMTKFKKTENLPIKSIHDGFGEIQRQQYEVTVKGSKKSFSEFKSTFFTDPELVLDNSKADFGNLRNKDGSEILKKGTNIDIDILGPLNNSSIRASEVSEEENGFKVSFNTLEGHIEAGSITFSGKVDKEGNITFSVDGASRLSHGAAYSLAENKSRKEQSASWKEVLSNVVKFLNGSEENRSIKINRFEYDKDKRDGIGKVKN